jgi:hypothetical protein
MLNEKSLLLLPTQPLSSLDADHEWLSTDETITNGLVSELTDSGVIGGANMTQTNDTYRPQFEYDKTGKFTAEAGNLTLSGTDVDAWGNSATATTRSLHAMTGSGATRPTWNSGTNSVDFSQNDALLLSVTSRTYNTFSTEFYGKLPYDISLNARVYIFSNNSAGVYGFQIFATKTAANVYAITLSVRNGVSFVDTTKTYTSDQYATISTNNVHIIATFINGVSTIYLDTNVIATTTSSVVTSILTQNTSASCLISLSSIGVMEVKKSNIFETALTASEISLLYANRNDFNYELPKIKLTSTAASKMIATIDYGTLTKLSFFAFIRVPLNVYLPALDLYYPILTQGSVNNRVEMRLRTNATDAYFRFYLDIGGTVYGANADVLTISAFKTKYAGKNVLVVGTYNVAANEICTHVYLDGTVKTGVYNTLPASYSNTTHDITILGREDEATYAPIGTRMFVSGMFRDRAISATETWRLAKYYESIEPTLINS